MMELKRCPRCGGYMKICESLRFTSEGSKPGYSGYCPNCGDRTRTFFSRSEAIEATNRRPASENDGYMDGVKYAIYEIMKEADIPGSQEIRDSGDTDDGMCARVAERIRMEISSAPENKALTWIPVAERPPQDDRYLGYDARRDWMFTVLYRHGHWSIDSNMAGSFLLNITHWMPLPGKPEEVSNDK